MAIGRWWQCRGIRCHPAPPQTLENKFSSFIRPLELFTFLLRQVDKTSNSTTRPTSIFTSGAVCTGPPECCSGEIVSLSVTLG